MLEVTLQAVRVGGLREQSAQFGLEAALLALQATDLDVAENDFVTILIPQSILSVAD